VVVLERSGYIIEREMKSHAAERYALRYTNLQGSRDRIVIDINYMYRICLTEPESIQPNTTFIDFDSEVLILGRDELIASKLSALLERRAPRDLYDLHKVVQEKLNYNESLLRKLAILFTSGKKLDFRRLNADCLQDITQRSVDEELNPLLRVRDRASLGDMMESVEPLVLKTLNLSSKEAEFIDSLLERGNYNPTILFDNHEIIQKAQLHPLLHWKAMNVKKHKGIK
jgi:predicted nucleotidyltransferase component of viral defense system